MPFQPGNKLGKGQPKGAPLPGRPSDRFKELCRRAFEDAEGLRLMVDIAKGEDFPQVATNQGTVLPLPPELKERRAAVEWIAERGYGKPDQHVDVNEVNASMGREELEQLIEDNKEALASVREILRQAGMAEAE